MIWASGHAAAPGVTDTDGYIQVSGLNGTVTLSAASDRAGTW